MDKRKNKIFLKRAFSLMLSAVVLFTGLPLEMLAAPQSMESKVADEDVLLLQNDSISVRMSGKNGGFYISNVEGDKTIKSDNNKDLLYHSDDYDTSFTSFRITRNGETKDYIFGGDYSFEGIKSGGVTVSQDAKGLSAKWSLGELEFTQRLELANTGSNEHGMVMINYDVQNHGSEDVKVEARMLLDSAVGDQDFVYYEIPNTSYDSDIIKRECVLDAANIPTAFYAYDDIYSPTATASTVVSSKGMLKKVAFAHWNSLAATGFDFAPDETLDFTSDGNDQYGTADSAMAMYYDLGTIQSGKEGIVNTYYGVFSNEKTDLETDQVTFNMTSPSVLDLSADGKNYVSTCNRNTDGTFKEDGIIDIQATLKNISEKNDYKKVVIAAYASEGLTPLDEDQKEPIYETSYAVPYQSTYVDFTRGTEIKIPFYFRAKVDSASSYRKITFRVFNLPDSTDARLLYENLLYEGSTYILCPGGNGELPKITFHSATPEILYNDLTRHLYVSGSNFTMLEDKSRYTLYAQGASDSKKYEIPSENILIDPQENKLDILFTETMKPDTYQLSFEWTEPPTGVDKITTGDALKVVMSDDIRYRNDYYGILAVVQEKGKTGDQAKYQLKTYASEEAYAADKNNYEETLLFFQGSFIKDDTFDKGADGTNVKYVAKSISGEKDKVVINGCIDALNGTVEVSQKDGVINTDFNDITLNASVENTRIYKGNAAFTSIENGTEYGLVPYNMNGEEIEGFQDEEITLTIQDVSSINGEAMSEEITLTAYADELITKVSTTDDLNDAQDVQESEYARNGVNFLTIDDAYPLSDTQGLNAQTSDFTISMLIQSASSDAAVLSQGEEMEIGIDQDGFLYYQDEAVQLTSRHEVTTVTEKAHGTFGSDAYVPTSTETAIAGQVNDGNLHLAHVVREHNGMVKIYIDGELVSSGYADGKTAEFEQQGLTLGSGALKANIAEVKVRNDALSYSEIEAEHDAYRLSAEDSVIDKTAWTASADSEELDAWNPAQEGPAELAIDGDESTWWHTEFTASKPECPHWLMIDLGEMTTFDKLEYVSRNGNGSVRDYMLEISTDGEQWETISEGNVLADPEATQEEVDQAVQTMQTAIDSLQLVENSTGSTTADTTNTAAAAQTAAFAGMLAVSAAGIFLFRRKRQMK